jgi:hypothetical protein
MLPEYLTIPRTWKWHQRGRCPVTGEDTVLMRISMAFIS